ncbi:WD40 repeat domain-containing protein [Gemmata massiliana]|uniref:WD40 repeat domain-containing protein n=1 Tax=Gemmata massiliana TaxID=1210884 RepID=UPI0013A6AE5E|nr:WD40 repeat domain-containing protein [Gemmata massiliana]
MTGGQQVRAWDTAFGAVLPAIDRVFDQFNAQYTVTPDGRSLIVCDQGSVSGYDPQTGRERFTWKLADRGAPDQPGAGEKHPRRIAAVAASPDGKALAIAVAGVDYVDPTKGTHELVLAETETGNVIRRVRTPETLPGLLTFSPDGRRIAGSRCVWDAGTLKELGRFPAKLHVMAAGFRPDGRQVATGHFNGTARVWTIDSD